MSETTQAITVSTPQRAPVPMGERGLKINDLDGLVRFSQYVSKSGLAPKGMESVEAIFVAVQYGFEVGLTPMAALQNIAPINGRPALWGDAQLGVVRGSGLLDYYAEEETNDELHPLFVELCLESDPEKRRMLKKDLSRKQAKIQKGTEEYGFSVCVRRVNEEERFQRFTVADAKKAGLWAKAGPWSQYPQRMLKFRARSFILRDVFGDALKGIISAEEALDIGAEDRFARAKPALGSVVFGSSVANVHEYSPGDFAASPSPDLGASGVSATTVANAPEAKPAKQTPQEKLAEWLTETGFDWPKLHGALLEAGFLETPVKSLEDLPADIATRALRAKAGLIAEMQKEANQ